jgi:uncharacterized spore protein YtfJ
MAEKAEGKLLAQLNNGHHSVAERLAERLGLSASAKTVFAEPVQREGVTVIPVARVRYGFGGGGGGSEEGQGNGGGGMVQAFPLGYIEIKDGKSAFHRLKNPANAVRLVLAVGVVGILFLRQFYKHWG